MSEWYDKKIVGSGIIIALVIALIWYLPTVLQIMQPAAVVPTAPKFLYTTGLTVTFRIMDDTSMSLVTSGVQPVFYRAGANPFAINSLDRPVAVATYSETLGFWVAVLDAGSYVLVVADSGTPTRYPERVTVTVTGTNNTDMTVVLSPSIIHLVQRATPTITLSIYAYNPASGAYDISVDKINASAYTRWQIDYRVSLAGIGAAIKAGRVYLTSYPGLTVASAVLDGTPVPVYVDTDPTDDGMVGNYILYNMDWPAGTHLLSIYLSCTGTPAEGTYTLTLFDHYQCLNPLFRWWSPETASVNVVS